MRSVSALLRSTSSRDCSVIACWQRNRQCTQPPATARRRRTDKKKASVTAIAIATVAATAIAAIRPAEPRKCLADRPDTRTMTRMRANILSPGRA